MKKEQHWKVIENKETTENACQKFDNKLPYSITPLHIALFVMSSIPASSLWKPKYKQQKRRQTKI